MTSDGESARDRQVGGGHYRNAAVQPIDLITALDLNFCAGNVVKYVSRYRFKGTPVEDLEKARHYLDFLLEQVRRDVEG